MIVRWLVVVTVIEVALLAMVAEPAMTLAPVGRPDWAHAAKGSASAKTATLAAKFAFIAILPDCFFDDLSMDRSELELCREPASPLRRTPVAVAAVYVSSRVATELASHFNLDAQAFW